MKNSLCFGVLFLVCLVNSAIISTSLGQLNGEEIGEFHLFKRIPFARPPIGKLRFQRPVPADKRTGVREANVYGPACMSNSSVSTSPQKWVDEDCLHINIFTSSKCLKSNDCAVVVYFHGGGLQYDSAVMFNDTYLLGTFVNHDVILAIPAFRLGIFSHFVVEDQRIAPNNLALYDILQALEFVKSDIHNFGGNNKKVTIMGHSYGATVASILTFSTKINNDLSLFQQTISMSSGHDFETLDFQIQKTRMFAEQANCTVSRKIAKNLTKNQQDTYMMKCLQDKDAMELLRIQRFMEDSGYPNMALLIQREPLMQEVPYTEFFDSPKKIPTLAGCTRYEFDHSTSKKLVAEVISFENPKQVDQKYRLDSKTGAYDFGNHSDETQEIMILAKNKVDKLISKGIPAFLYEYTYPKHAKHTDDLFYLMGVHRFEKDENEQHLAKVYENIFMNFAKFGQPGEGFEISNLENSTYYDVYWNEETGERPKMKSNFEKNIMNYWFKDMVAFDKNLTLQKKGELSPKKPARRFYTETSEHNQISSLFFSVFLVSCIFTAGYLFGRYFCSTAKNRNLYIEMEGCNVPTTKNPYLF